MLAYCLLCETNIDLYWGGFDHTPARRELAHVALQQAERIQPGEVHVQKGVYAYHGFRDYEVARTEFELARRTLPNSSRLQLHIGAIDRRQARWSDNVRKFERAVQVDPRMLSSPRKRVLPLQACGARLKQDRCSSVPSR